MLRLSDLGFLLLELAITDLCYLAVVTDLLGTLSLEAKSLDVYLSLLDTIDELLLPHPLRLISGLLLLEGSDLLIQFLELGLIILSTDRLTLDLKLCNSSPNLI